MTPEKTLELFNEVNWKNLAQFLPYSQYQELLQKLNFEHPKIVRETFTNLIEISNQIIPNIPKIEDIQDKEEIGLFLRYYYSCSATGKNSFVSTRNIDEKSGFYEAEALFIYCNADEILDDEPDYLICKIRNHKDCSKLIRLDLGWRPSTIVVNPGWWNSLSSED